MGNSAVTWEPNTLIFNSLPLTNRWAEVFNPKHPSSFAPQEVSLSQEAYWIDAVVGLIWMQLADRLGLVKQSFWDDFEVETPIHLNLPPKEKWTAKFVIDDVRHPRLQYPE